MFKLINKYFRADSCFKFRRSAFTLIEAIIVISVLVVLGALATLNLGSFSNRGDLEGARLLVVSAIRQAQSNSTANLGDHVWGMRFGSEYITIFPDEGAGFNEQNPANKIVSLPKGVNVTADFGGSNELLFEKNQTKVSQNGTVTLSAQGKSVEVIVNQQGSVDY